MRTLAKAVALSSLLMMTGGLNAGPFTEADIQASFYPYDNWTPTYEGYEPGVTIDESNVEQYKEIIDEALYQFIKDGWVAIKTKPTTDFPLSEDYVEATRKYAEPVTVNEIGTLDDYVAGRAFPKEPDPDDPKAGLKLVWNYQYGFNSGDSETIHPFWWTFRNMRNNNVERVLKFEWHFMNYTHRVSFEPTPTFERNPSEIFRGIYSFVEEPYDLANTQLLIHRYEDDTERDDAWLYLGFQRRVRRLPAGQTTDSFLGSDLMIEDFEGYNGRVSDYTWEYGGTRNLLVPFYYHNDLENLSSEPANDPDGFRFVAVHGKGNCFPNVPYQLRKTHTLIGRPKDPNHPLSRRVINLDAQTMTMATLIVYDRKGDMWRWFPIGKAHSDYHAPENKGRGVALDDFAVLLDVQAQHCTTLQFKSVITPEGNQPNTFTIQNLRKRGR